MADPNVLAMFETLICNHRGVPSSRGGTATNAGDVSNGYEGGFESEGYTESRSLQSDREIFKLLQKRQKACTIAANEFQNAGRAELVGKEHEQAGILQGYLNQFDIMSTDQTVTAIRTLVDWMNSKGTGPRRETVRKQLFQEGGPLHNQIVDDALVTTTIEELVKDIPPLKKNSEKKKLMAKERAERRQS
ncbi:MAG: hypothetical protein Q9170_006247 [Blastenia crenularia]